MEANKILQADVLDILFENRNKAYGAYELRTTYNRRVTYALTGMGICCLLFIGASIFANSTKTAATPLMVKDFELTNVKQDEPKEQVKIEQPKPQLQQQATIRNTVPKIMPDDQVKKEDTPPDNDAMENMKIGIENKAGVDGDVVTPPLEEKGTGAGIELKKTEDYEHEVFTVQRMAKFPGGEAEWRKFLEKNLRAELPAEMGAAPGKYTVAISFLVNKDGYLSEIKALNDPGFGTAEEAVRVFKKSIQWEPAEQNGRKVIYRQQQSITFIVQDGN